MNLSKANMDIRKKIDSYGLRHYEVAKELNMKPSNFSIMLKCKLTEEQKNRIFSAIQNISLKKMEG